VQGEGLLAGGDSLQVLTEQGVVPADRVEGSDLPGLVAGGPVQVEGLLGVVQCPCGAAPAIPQEGQGVVGGSLPGLVADLGGQVEGVAQLGVSVVEATKPDVGVGEIAVGVGLR